MATQQDLDAINAAIAKLIAGERVTEVQYSDRTVRYQRVSLAELKAERARIEAELAGGSRLRPMFYGGLDA